jgi:integrase
MPRRNQVPSYRLHKQSGQAIVTLTDVLGGRRDVLMGPFDTPQSRAEFARVITEWESAGRRLVGAARRTGPSLSIAELLLAYWRFAEGFYVKDGKPTSEQDAIRSALRFVRVLYGQTDAEEFGPLSLKAVRQAMITHPITRRVKVVDDETKQVKWMLKVIQHGLTRRVINKQIGRIKRMFAWAVEEELLPAAVHQALLRVTGRRRGKGEAREKPRIKPVPDTFVDAILPHVPPTVAAMIELQRLCGGRPQDIVGMRAIDIDMTGAIWEYRPCRYKTEHHNDEDSPEKERIVFLGPRAQTILKPYLTLNLTAYIFSPIRSEQERNARRRDQRRSRMTPSQAKRKARGRKKAPLRDQYDVASYRRAIRRGCSKAGVPVWCPLQLRHARATEVRKWYGLEASQAVLGHSELGVTQVYAEVNRESARRVMEEIG